MPGSPPRHSRRSPGPTVAKGWLGSVHRFWLRYYASDYLGLVILLTIYILVVFLVEPFHRLFSLEDVAIQFPHATKERVPVPWLFVYAGAVPLLLIIAILLAFDRNKHKAHVTLLGFFISLIMTSLVTDTIKNAVGRPRPDLISRCVPGKNSAELSKLVSFRVCTQTNSHILHDGFRSFPSGHSSFSFAGLGYLTLFICGQLHVFRPLAPASSLSAMLAACAPLLGAALIAISRCEDYRHDVWDVCFGSVLGFAIAWLQYRRYYPSLRHSRCDVPFPGRCTQWEMAKLKNDEESAVEARRFELGEESDSDEHDHTTSMLNARVA
ncbi:acid phosphatase/Vanadium-dependent haloperoxidase [Eremomyces bilateralis CBS 781.70]|uniref:Acid phosphatase/Vanadium-dependent haloperoxidase n=1 Tax=Eremomyces bilateralis CBS 781.70 TaxID=1392243 RepID=A0A6G1FQR2_9PEZI|nr:acid phosphatase/Vanadium-dependent haloperoxidase [Eremomyces bilateralis CBS 781.70]KAF1808031.1 acid phosphatase/Vanadium-dependent haloperoxidase [Eremomyces bilateralis CBS 781.70]